MSTGSCNTPVSVSMVEQLIIDDELDINDDDDELDDDVFINQDALQMNSYLTKQSDPDPALQIDRYFKQQSDPSPSTKSPVPIPSTKSPVPIPVPKSKAFFKLVKTTQFVKKWTRKAECPVPEKSTVNDELYSASIQKSTVNDELYSASIQRIPSTFINENTPTTRHRRLLDKTKFLERIVWNPTGNCLHIWMGIVSLAVIYNTIMMIVHETYHQFNDFLLLPLWFILDYGADIIYLMDMGVRGTTGYLDQGLLVTNLNLLFSQYSKSKYFVLDILSILPTDLLYFVPEIGVIHTVVRINRLLRIHRLLQFLNRTESRTNFPNLFRVFQLILLISLIIHWNACFYFLISKGLGLGSDSWVYPALTDNDGINTEYANLSRQYLLSLYWSTLTLTTIGELPGPVRDAEYVFVIFDFLVGVIIFATIVGMVGGIITNMNMRRAEFQEKLDNLKQYMRYRRVGQVLQDRVIKCFDYQWTNNQTLNEEKILQSLPSKLQAEIAIHVHFETLRHVKIFDQFEAGLLEELVLKLKPQVFSPGDYVCRKGDVGKEMYIIKHGFLEVVGDDNTTVYATLTGGGYFGEISILNLSDNGNRRTASVRSVGYSDLFCLSKLDLLESLEEYPQTKTLLEEWGNRKLVQDGTLEKGATNQDMSPTDSSSPNGKHESKMEQLEYNIEQLQIRFTRLLGEYNTSQMSLKWRVYALEKETKTRA